MPSSEMPLTGYLDRLSRRPGEPFTAYVSVRDGGPYRARLLRVLSGDPNPSGPGLQFQDLSARFDSAFTGRRQAIALGSYAVVDRTPTRDAEEAVTWTVLVQPTRLDRKQVVLAHGDAGCSVVLAIDPEFGATAEIVLPESVLSISAGQQLKASCWYRLWLSADPASGRFAVGQQALDGSGTDIAQRVTDQLALPTGGRLSLAADITGGPSPGQAPPTAASFAQQHFTGKLEAPALLRGFVSVWHEPLAMPDEIQPVAAWDFSQGIDTQTILDTGSQACHGRLVNLPVRAVVGARWTGNEMCWRHAPQDYAAIHFHADDLGDCDWEPDFSWTVPDDLASGAYALHLSCATGEDWLPLYVLPRREGPFAPIAYLAATFTYQAYANHARGNTDAAFQERVAAWGAYPHNPDQYPIYGRSTYNRHLDGSGISFSSRRRPMLTMRPGYLTFNDARGSGLRHYPADTHLLAWLEARGFAFDIITDEDLDDEGADILAPYRAVITGSHPEYHTPGTLDALTEFQRQGGNLAYLGGNGFYWRIARDKAMPHVIELRRAEGGIRAWAAEPGEYYHQLDGGYGGLWRRNRRPPQLLAGVGFSGQGLFEGTHYRLLPTAREPRFAWMFEGIEGDILGDYGLSGGGAAGFELDRADTSLGTPDDAVILARSEDPPASVVTVPEELLSHLSTWNGEAVDALRRGEIVYFDTPMGGAVFAVGSITFCGSLWRKGWDGPVSRLLENVVRRFAQES